MYVEYFGNVFLYSHVKTKNVEQSEDVSHLPKITAMHATSKVQSLNLMRSACKI